MWHHIQFNLTCLNLPTNRFLVALIDKSTTPSLSTPLSPDLFRPPPLMVNPTLLSSNLYLFKDPLLPPSHQNTLKSLTFHWSHHPPTSHIKRSYSNCFRTYPLKDTRHQWQIPMNNQRSDSRAHHECRWSAGINRLPAKKYLQITHLRIRINLFPQVLPDLGRHIRILQVPAGYLPG